MFSDALLGVHVVVHVEARRGLGHRVRVLGHHGFARPVNVLFEILERGDPDLVVAHDITGGGLRFAPHVGRFLTGNRKCENTLPLTLLSSVRDF